MFLGSERGLVYKIDFHGDRKAYLETSLGDLIYEDFVMIYDTSLKKKDFKEAKRDPDGEYYYTDSGKRVNIKTKTLFCIAFEKQL